MTTPFQNADHGVNTPYDQTIQTGYSSAFSNVEALAYSPRIPRTTSRSDGKGITLAENELQLLSKDGPGLGGFNHYLDQDRREGMLRPIANLAGPNHPEDLHVLKKHATWYVGDKSRGC
jgi:hypothetical protein